MPSLTTDHTLTLHNTAQIFTLPLEYHMLKAASVRCIACDTQGNDNWIQLAVLSGGAEIENLVSVLKAGYGGLITPIYWTGSLPVEPDTYLAAIISGKINAQFRLSCVLWKIRLDEKGEFRADP